MENDFLLHKHRSDRRKLLEFIISAGLVGEVRTPPGAVEWRDVDLDTVSIDYVLECVKHGGALDLSEGTKRYFYERDFPIVINSQSGSSYFLLTEAELSGTPPHRVAPQVFSKPIPKYSSCSSTQLDPSVVEELVISGDEDVVGCSIPTVAPRGIMKDADTLSLGLPILSTGLSDDDLRETAYEVLVASVAFSGGQILAVEGKKKEKKTKFLTRLRSKRESLQPQPQSADSRAELLDIIRIQMEISEAMDACIRQGLIQFGSRSMSGQIGIPEISLELLSATCKSDFSNERSYMQWHKRKVKVLEELLYNSAVIPEGQTKLRCYLSKLKNIEEWAARMTPSECAEVLKSIRKLSMKLSSMPSKFGIPGETYFWTACYSLNVKLYEKLLFSVFDILEEGQLVEEAEEILRILKSTWFILGITQKMHDTLYGWVLFRQFVGTGETTLLEHAILEIQKVALSEDCDGNEGAYMKSLVCSVGAKEDNMKSSLMDAVFLSMSSWCDYQLQDYHLHFTKDSISFGKVLTLVVLARRHTADQCGETELNKHMGGAEMDSEHIKGYVVRSMKAVYKRVLDILDVKSEVEKRHHLAVLADEVKLIVQRESTIFSPELCRWCPEAGILPLMLLHRYYGERLKPFLKEVTHLSADVRSVLPAADTLDNELIQLLHTMSGEDTVSKNLHSYQVGEISAPVILQWVNAQHDKILEWTERAFHLEDWEPLSSQQRQAASIIEIFRIIEETVEQFFNLNLPMDVIHLQSLLLGIYQGLEAYLLKLVDQLADKNHLYPSAPALTRYKESGNLFIKKKPIDCTFLEDKVLNQLNELTTSKLCVRLNTLHYIQNQIRTLEGTIRKCWMLVRPCVNLELRNEQSLGVLKEKIPTFNGSVDELFTPFDSIKRMTDGAINEICDFIGTRIVFWDLRDLFLFSLYRGNVESSRLERNLPQLDAALDHVCDLIVESLRDAVALSICRASWEGFVWVLLDGGPSRAFSDTDITMMQEDLSILKDFFVANGQGLPRAVVEQEAKLAQQILNLYGLEVCQFLTEYRLLTFVLMT
eukprot:TRINITY_DN35584_c0_g1_i5.p1 TRINITY_DN35584_c0_g1~~TRINITY_DN35584_c0_g1_i5.p1  ORF type:complete len:1048 (+),score=208.43 TRINITY_DN35584_c0_g1_i5:473-3616(+)